MEPVSNPRPSNGIANGNTAAPPSKPKPKYTSTPSDEPQQHNHDNPDVASPISPVASPPYWVQSHTRSASNISIESVLPGGITLEDNTHGEDPKNKACWAKSVYIADFVVVNGGKTSIGAFVVWNVTVETLRGASIRIRKRYSEFDELRYNLLQTFPNSAGALPPIPPKSVISKFRPNFLENRRVGLQYFLNCILLNPEFSGSPVLKRFLFE